MIAAPHFLPCCQFLTKAQAYSLLILDDSGSFEKQAYQNRAYISGANKVQRLTVPLKQGKTKQPFRDIAIDYQDNWPRKLWTAIASAYGKTPYFPFFAHEVEQLLKSRQRFLLDLNLHALELLASGLKMDLKYQWLSETPSADLAEQCDTRSFIHPRRPWQEDKQFEPVPYAQAFIERFGFLANLSGLDLLFNEGPQGRAILKQSHRPMAGYSS
jgi:hypothetical protein